MSKLLRVLVVFLLLLSIGAVALGTMLFMKRELLKGRTQKLENAVIALGATVEAEAAPAESKPVYPARDVSPVSSQVLDTPELSTFWDKYQSALEKTDLPPLQLGNRRAELMTYYKWDLVNNKPARDPATGLKITSGEGTMQQVLDDLLTKSREQLDRLNVTRHQLKDLREELVRTIEELNALKRNHRQALKTIEELEAEVRRLKDRITALEKQVATLEEEKRGLEEQITEKNKQIGKLESDLVGKDTQIQALNERIEELEGVVDRQAKIISGGDTKSPAPERLSVRVEPGEKGRVIAVNPDWNFVVLKLSEDFIAEALPEKATAVPPVELMVKRFQGGTEKFVTKIRLVQIKKSEGLGVADIMPDWQQDSVKKGDVVFF